MLKSSETPLRSPLTPFGELPRWGAKNVLLLNLIALPRGGRLRYENTIF